MNWRNFRACGWGSGLPISLLRPDSMILKNCDSCGKDSHFSVRTRRPRGHSIFFPTEIANVLARQHVTTLYRATGRGDKWRRLVHVSVCGTAAGWLCGSTGVATTQRVHK
jgi:hypothetical protein